MIIWIKFNFVLERELQDSVFQNRTTQKYCLRISSETKLHYGIFMDAYPEK
jgi:hypothetical protein